MKIKAANDDFKKVLEAAIAGDVDYLKRCSPAIIRQARCSSGCTPLHWAAGSNSVSVAQYLISLLDVNVRASKSAKGRTPLHYACRNGHLEMVHVLIRLGAQVDARAKHNVSPFQLAVWQNHLEICKVMVEDYDVNPAQINGFDCGAVHWIGICPVHRADYSEDVYDISDHSSSEGKALLPLAEWLAQQQGISFHLKQRQGHSPLHKAAWGGHTALLRYLRDEHGCMDDAQDQAGNYAADLADMANSPRHKRAAEFLRKSCSPARSSSCAALGITVNASQQEIRQAYLRKAKETHPDRYGATDEFDKVRAAYHHLTQLNGVGTQANPVHSLNLMLEVGRAKTRNDEMDNIDDDDCFKARLTAVLLEYGDKGMDLSNVKKKWSQVWPEVPFPTDVGERRSKDDQVKRKGVVLRYIQERAGDTVEIVPAKDNSGRLQIFPTKTRHDVHAMNRSVINTKAHTSAD